MKCHTTSVLTGNVGKFFKTSFLPSPVQFCLAVVVVVVVGGGFIIVSMVSQFLVSLSFSVTLNDEEKLNEHRRRTRQKEKQMKRGMELKFTF